ncbi:MAG: hypothetical protein HY347_09305 [candidate division NC10 bacterium]|nr:hypothetical protein [candidate division NC10 bacterium]
MMPNKVTLDQLEQLVAQLPPQEQLKLVVHICEQLSALPFAIPTVVDDEELQRQREKEADELLALCDAAAEKWEGEFDSAGEIRQMRRDRDEQIWRSKP